jgi:hypothetical protein
VDLWLMFRCPQECGDWLAETDSAGDSVKVTVVGVDLDIQDVPEWQEEEPGGFVALNGLLPITLQPVLPATLPGTDLATLTWTNDAKIDVYENQDRTNPINSGKTYALSALPKTLYVEGDQASDQPRDVEITLSYSKGGATAEDVVKVTVMVEVESVHPVSGDFASGKVGRVMISTSKDDNYYTIVKTTANDTVAQTSDGQVTISAYIAQKVEGGRVYFEVLDPDDLSPYERDARVTGDFEFDEDFNDDVLQVNNTSAYTAHPNNGTEVAIYVKTSTEATPICRIRKVKAKTDTTITLADLDINVASGSLVRLTTPEADRNDNSDGFGTMAGGTLSAYNGFQNCLSARWALTQIKTINGVERAVAEVTLTITDHCAGDNYVVRATGVVPENKPFNDASGVTPNTADADIPAAYIVQTATLVAWKRVYLEYHQMYREGATLTAPFTADDDGDEGDDDLLTVDNTDDFIADTDNGTEVVIFGWGMASIERRVLDKTATTITVDDLPTDLLQYSGVKVKASNAVFDAGLGRLDDAFGAVADGSDGGAFVEFVPLEGAGVSDKVPLYKVFPDAGEVGAYCVHWFYHLFDSANVVQLVAGATEAEGVFGLSGPGNWCWIGVAEHAGPNGVEVTVAHELGHQLGASPGDNGHIDATGPDGRVVNHDGADYCIMSNECNADDDSDEFDLDCLTLVRGEPDPI